MPFRTQIVSEIRACEKIFDVIVIGGGANGCGVALDAASRGLRVALFERFEFGAGTSSRSSKLIHGGIRYLAQGRVSLVREALSERATLLAAAPGIVTPQRFFIPARGLVERLKFSLGVTIYDYLAGPQATAGTPLAADTEGKLVEQLKPGFVRGVCYDDAVFDDCALLQAILRRARSFGAITLNHAAITGMEHDIRSKLTTISVRDAIDGSELTVRGRAIVNAAGAYVDEINQWATTSEAARSVTPSRGAHVVVPREFFDSNHALVFPRTPDGRIMFALPWYGRVLLGTTDTPTTDTTDSPRPSLNEIDSILDVASHFLVRAPAREDVLSCFAGLRPLAGAPAGQATAKRSREHRLSVGPTGMLTISGGKWTTYRLIAEQAVNLACSISNLKAGECITRAMKLSNTPPTEALQRNGSPGVEHTQGRIHSDLPWTTDDVRFAVREAAAVNLSDVLAFHTRFAFVDLELTRRIAPAVARIMAEELRETGDWVEQQCTAANEQLEQFAITPTRAP